MGNTECMMTSITQTSASTGLVMSTVTWWGSTLWLYLMVGFSMCHTMLMLTMVVLSWRCLTVGRPGILMWSTMVMVELEGELEVGLEVGLEVELVEESAAMELED